MPAGKNADFMPCLGRHRRFYFAAFHLDTTILVIDMRRAHMRARLRAMGAG